MEDDIVARLARTVGIQMISVEAARAARTRPGNPDAQDLGLRCIASLLNNPEASANPSKHPEIYEPCERALAIDPHNTLAMAALSTRLLQRVTLGEIADPTAEANRFDHLATEALAINSNDQDAHIAKAAVAFVRGQPDQVLLEAERVMAINPSAIFAYAIACGAANMIGQPDKAIDYADRARRLSPRDPSLFNCLVQRAVALSILGRNQDALEALDRTLVLSSDNRQLLRLRPAYLAMAGRADGAREASQRYAALPGKQIRTIAEYKAFLGRAMPSNAPLLVSWRARYLDALRAAGMPEQ